MKNSHDVPNAFIPLNREFEDCKTIRELGEHYAAAKDIIDKMFRENVDRIIDNEDSTKKEA